MYSKDFKQMAVKYRQAGHSFKELQEAFGIPAQTYYIWERNLKIGYYDKKVVHERKGKIDKEKLRQAVKDMPDAYLRELGALFGCSAQAIFKSLKKMKITIKKKTSTSARGLKKSVLNI
jgi:transposase